jgi:hypothetical protein
MNVVNVVNVAAFWSRVEVIWGGGDPVWKDGSGVEGWFRQICFASCSGRVVLGKWSPG